MVLLPPMVLTEQLPDGIVKSTFFIMCITIELDCERGSTVTLKICLHNVYLQCKITTTQDLRMVM